MKYIVTKEIKSETQVLWIFYLQDFVFLTVWAVIILMMKEQIHETLQVFYVIFSTLVGIGLMLPSYGNARRRMYQSLALYLLRPRCVLRYGKEKSEDEKEKTISRHQKGYSHSVL